MGLALTISTMSESQVGKLPLHTTRSVPGMCIRERGRVLQLKILEVMSYNMQPATCWFIRTAYFITQETTRTQTRLNLVVNHTRLFSLNT